VAPHVSKDASYASAVKTPSNNNTGAYKGQIASKYSRTKTIQILYEDYQVLVIIYFILFLGAREKVFFLRRHLIEKINSLIIAKIPIISLTISGWAFFLSDLAIYNLLFAESSQVIILETLDNYKISVPEV
jgi:hypothetical protein